MEPICCWWSTDGWLLFIGNGDLGTLCSTEMFCSSAHLEDFSLSLSSRLGASSFITDDCSLSWRLSGSPTRSDIQSLEGRPGSYSLSMCASLPYLFNIYQIEFLAQDWDM